MATSEERFARQHPFDPPPDFRLASVCAAIAHCLSGPTQRANTHNNLRRIKCGRWCGRLRRTNVPPSVLLSLRVKVLFVAALEKIDRRLLPTRTLARLLGPCSKTGRMNPFRQHHERARKIATLRLEEKYARRTPTRRGKASSTANSMSRLVQRQWSAAFRCARKRTQQPLYIVCSSVVIGGFFAQSVSV